MSAPSIKLFLTVIVGPRSADMCWSRFAPLSAPPDHDQLLRSKTSHDHAPPALIMIAWASNTDKIQLHNFPFQLVILTPTLKATDSTDVLN